MAKVLDGPRVGPAAGGPARQLVIFAHGYGSNGDDLIGLAPYFAQALPEAAFVAPNAPELVPGFPGGAAYQWFPITAMDPDRLAAGVQSAAPTPWTPSSTRSWRATACRRPPAPWSASARAR